MENKGNNAKVTLTNEEVWNKLVSEFDSIHKINVLYLTSVYVDGCNNDVCKWVWLGSGGLLGKQSRPDFVFCSKLTLVEDAAVMSIVPLVNVLPY